LKVSTEEQKKAAGRDTEEGTSQDEKTEAEMGVDIDEIGIPERLN